MKSIILKKHCLYGEQIFSDEPQIGDKVKVKGMSDIYNVGEIVDIYMILYTNIYWIKFENNQKVTYLREHFEVI